MKPIVGGVLRAVGLGAVAVGLVAGANQVNGRVDVSQSTRPLGATTTSPVTTAEVVCAGQELAGVGGVKDVLVQQQVGAAAAPGEALAGLTLPPGGQIQVPNGRQPLLTTDKRGQTLPVPVPGGGLIRAIGHGGLAPGLAATQEWAAQAKDLRGLATAPCGVPAPESWLVGGGAAPGRQERIVLVNPGANEVTADIAVHGRAGLVTGAAGSSATVPARGRKVLLLDAIAPSEAAPIIRVVATGGSLWATLSDTWLDGSIPAGAESTTRVAAPSTRLVVPGVNLGGPATLRIGVPGAQEAVVSARLIGPDGGKPLVGRSVIRVAAGGVAELPLKAAAGGTYAVEVRSDEPVVGSVLTTARAGAAPGDFAWSVATEPLEELAGAPFAPAPEGQPRTRSLTLVATGGAVQVTVMTVDAAGRVNTQDLNLPADTSAAVGVGAPASVWVRRNGGSGELRGSIVSASGRGDTRLMSSVPLQDSVLTSTVSRAFPLP